MSVEMDDINKEDVVFSCVLQAKDISLYTLLEKYMPGRKYRCTEAVAKSVLADLGNKEVCVVVSVVLHRHCMTFGHPRAFEDRQLVRLVRFTLKEDYIVGGKQIVRHKILDLKNFVWLAPAAFTPDFSFQSSKIELDLPREKEKSEDQKGKGYKGDCKPSQSKHNGEGDKANRKPLEYECNGDSDVESESDESYVYVDVDSEDSDESKSKSDSKSESNSKSESESEAEF